VKRYVGSGLADALHIFVTAFLISREAVSRHLGAHSEHFMPELFITFNLSKKTDYPD
jgi:hypothetical protein